MMNGNTLSEKVIFFSRFLKNHGFKIFSSNVCDSLQSLEQIDICNRADFFSILRANLVTGDLEWKLFGELFEQFWQDFEEQEDDSTCDEPQEPSSCSDESIMEMIQEISSDQESGQEDPCKKEITEKATYSPVSTLERKSLAQIEKGDIQIAQLVLKNIISPFRTAVTRRYKKSKRPGDMDFHRVIRKSLKTGGIPLELFFKRKKKKLKRLVVLADVSGSMDRYARFVMPFIMGLKNLGSKVEVFVFATSLSPITPMVKRFSIDKALAMISHEVLDWSGGTRIGYSLHQFNEQYGETLLNKQTVIVILSDGWDLGGRNILLREMQTLSRKSHCIIWLNPLAGDTEYKPICKGMQTAMPYVNYFLPADSLESLKKVGRTLTRVMTH